MLSRSNDLKASHMKGSFNIESKLFQLRRIVDGFQVDPVVTGVLDLKQSAVLALLAQRALLPFCMGYAQNNGSSL
eukprot:1860871-Amphidinium_carterae.1